MGNSAVRQHIESAEKTGVCQLSKQNIEEIPTSLMRLVGNLRTLDLSENKISQLPHNFGNFQVLKNLQLNNNRLASLPDSFVNLKRLDSLNLSHNRLTQLPNKCRKLQALKNVSITHNKLTRFPVEFCELKCLDVLDLQSNVITEIPDEIEGLVCIELNLNQNQISSVSEKVAKCPRLKVLRLEENCLPLHAIPTAILRESQISLLALEGNLFEMKEFHNLEGYDKYMERYTATKKKFN